MLQGAQDLLESERGIFAIMMLISVTVLTFVGKISGEQWLDFNKWLAIALIGSKTVTTAIDTLKNPKDQPAAPTAQVVNDKQPGA